MMIKTVTSLLKHNKSFELMIIILVIDSVIIPLVSSDLLVDITNGDSSKISHFLALKVLEAIINSFIIRKLINSMGLILRKTYTDQQIRKYNTLSFENRAIKTSVKFDDLMEKSSFALFLVVEWGMPSVASLFGSFTMIVYTSIKKQMLHYILIGAGVLSIIYIVVIRPKQNAFTKYHKEFRNVANRYHEKIKMDLIPFQYKEYSPSHIINQKFVILEGYYEIEKKGNSISGMTTMLNSLFSMTICYLASSDAITFMLVLFMMESLSRSISSLTHFITQYNRIKNDYDAMNDFWEGCDFKTEPEKIDLLSPNDITHFEVKAGNVHLKLDKSFGKFTLFPKMKMLICGPTGHGKSTLKKALFGLIDSDIQLEYGSPKNFHHLVADYFQEIKEKMPTSKTTLRDFFKGEQDNRTIEKYLIQAWGYKYEGILNSIKDGNKNDQPRISDNVDLMEKGGIVGKKHPFDMSINECLSGGEKSRLLLWSRGYEVDANNKRIIILDEPCPDVDHDTYITTMNDFFDTYSHCMVIMIAHLCPCKKSSLNIHWDLEIRVENNVVFRL